MLMQIYADVIGRPMKVSRSNQTPALGAARFAVVAAGKSSGGHSSVSEAQKSMTGTGTQYDPIPANQAIYTKLYALYRQLHDGFGLVQESGSMHNIMKDLLDIRDAVRRGM